MQRIRGIKMKDLICLFFFFKIDLLCGKHIQGNLFKSHFSLCCVAGIATINLAIVTTCAVKGCTSAQKTVNLSSCLEDSVSCF